MLIYYIENRKASGRNCFYDAVVIAMSEDRAIEILKKEVYSDIEITSLSIVKLGTASENMNQEKVIMEDSFRT